MTLHVLFIRNAISSNTAYMSPVSLHIKLRFSQAHLRIEAESAHQAPFLVHFFGGFETIPNFNPSNVNQSQLFT